MGTRNKLVLDPFKGPDELLPATGEELVELVAFYKRTADRNGEAYDPEWDRWLAEDGAVRNPPGSDGIAEARRRFG